MGSDAVLQHSPKIRSLFREDILLLRSPADMAIKQLCSKKDRQEGFLPMPGASNGLKPIIQELEPLFSEAASMGLPRITHPGTDDMHITQAAEFSIY